jgi:tRNA pseudouridine65 synthase
MSLQILFEDEFLVVVNKNSGLLVHKSSIDAKETQFALQILRDQIRQRVFLVHRLDKPTSGALIFAKSKEIAALLSQEFVEQRVHKRYLAIVRGVIPQPLLIDYPLKPVLDRKNDPRAEQNKDFQAAQTSIKSLATVELPMRVGRYPSSRYSLIEACPLTGRQHQIRRHLKHISHPIIGDVNYGSGEHNRFFEKHFGVRRLFLACTNITFTHPVTKNLLSVDAPLENDFRKTIENLGLQ